MKKFPYTFYDNHVHLRELNESVNTIFEDFHEGNIEKAVALCVSDPKNPVYNDNGYGIWFKSQRPEDIYLFPGFEYSELSTEINTDEGLSLADQVALYKSLGADGWKMLEGKPSNHLKALNGDFYDEAFDALEKHNLPLLIHVGDPIEFWDKATLPKWALPNWSYGPDKPTLESLRSEMIGALEKHPNMKVILAHVFFLGYDLDRARDLLNRFPNVVFDLAPGVEMFFGFSQNVEKSHQFFTDFQDRILFGTDRGVADAPAAKRSEMIVRFLSTADHFDPPHTDPVMWPDDRAPIKGIALDDDVLKKILRDNLINLLGEKPAKLDMTLATKELQRLGNIYGPDHYCHDVIKRLNNS